MEGKVYIEGGVETKEEQTAVQLFYRKDAVVAIVPDGIPFHSGNDYVLGPCIVLALGGTYGIVRLANNEELQRHRMFMMSEPDYY